MYNQRTLPAIKIVRGPKEVSACYCSFPQDEVCTPDPCLSCSLCSLPRGHLQEVPPIHGRLQLPDEVLGREERGEAFRWDRDGEEEVHADG